MYRVSETITNHVASTTIVLAETDTLLDAMIQYLDRLRKYRFRRMTEVATNRVFEQIYTEFQSGAFNYTIFINQ